MAETKPRQRTKLVLPKDITKSVLTNRTKRDILQGALDTLLGAGVDISTEVAVGYLKELTEAVIAATQAYNEDMAEILSVAMENVGYDPETCSEIRDDLLETSGVVFWTGPTEGEA